MPGFLQLQADCSTRRSRLDRSETWKKLADDDLARLARRSSIWHVEAMQRAIYRWSAPPQSVLDQAVDVAPPPRRSRRRRCPMRPKTLLVIGHAPFTPGGIVFGDNGLEYTDAVGGGDGRVPLASAVLPGVRTWKLDADARRPADGRRRRSRPTSICSPPAQTASSTASIRPRSRSARPAPRWRC